jgi:hypothetical protein
MPYIPKSKITIKNTHNGSLVYKDTKDPYIGTYIQTSKGKYYVGTSNTNLGPELILNDLVDGGRNTFGGSKDTVIYHHLKSNIKKFLNNTHPVPVVKSTPTESDYKKGYYRRYFAKRVNGNQYLEIDKEIYNDIYNKKGRYDYNLYNVGSLIWSIKGKDVFRINSLEIKKTEINFPNIFYLFPILNEFLDPTTEIQENLHTDGGELYYGDSTEYIGSYHIHPVQGPMEGSIHTMSPHPKLYYFNQLPNIGDTTYEDFLSNWNKITCYKCVDLSPPHQQGWTGPRQVVGIRRSRLLGCPPKSFSDSIDSAGILIRGYDLAQASCPPQVPPPTTTTGRPGGDDHDPNTPNTPITTIPSTNDVDYGDYDPFQYPFGYPWNTGNYGGFSWSGTGGGGGGGGGGGTGGGGRPVYTCFTPNTLITMANGTEKPISSIKKGEKVKSEIGESKVLDIQIHEGDHEVYSINNEKPFVTEEHPFKTIDGWKAIDPFMTFEKHQIPSNVLNLQDIVYKKDGKEIIKSIEKGKVTYKKVYNLSLDNEHVYYANGYLVHNNKGAGMEDDDYGFFDGHWAFGDSDNSFTP